jgi:type VI secretion system secreted protein VgrG
VGDEVLVAALNNDPDKLVILGVLPGGTRKPGRFSGASELPGDKAISGLRSREHGGTLGSQMLMDDTPGEVRAHFSSDHAASELNLGFITQPRTGGVAQARGEGAELRTDGTASIRAAKGLLLTAAAQIRAGGPQLAREELAQLFESFKSLTDSLGDYAGQHQGLPPKTDPEKVLQGQLKDWETGTNTQPKTHRPSEGQRLIALSAPDGLVAATPKTAVVYAGENLDLAAQQYAHLTVGQQLVVNAGKGMSLFSHSGGFKAIAHQDDLNIQAQHGDIVMTAAKNVKMFASENEILISGSKKITLMCGGSYLTIAADGVVCGGPAFTGKVGSVSWPGPDSQSMDFPKIDMGKTQGKFQHFFRGTGVPIPNAAYTIKTKDGRVFQGKTDRDGYTESVELDEMEILSAEFKEDNHG